MRTQSAGFTLIELMVTVAVVAILLGLAVPNLGTAIQNNRATTQANALLAALNLARSEAVKRGTLVSVCPLEKDANPPDCADDDDWPNGWFVYLEGTNPKELLRVWPAPAGVAKFEGPSKVTYTGSGTITGTTASFQHEMTNCTSDQARTIEVSATGHATVAKSTCVTEGD